MESKYKNIIKAFDRNDKSCDFIKIKNITSIHKNYDVNNKEWNIYIHTDKFCQSEPYENEQECDAKFKELLEIWDKGIND